MWLHICVAIWLDSNGFEYRANARSSDTETGTNKPIKNESRIDARTELLEQARHMKPRVPASDASTKAAWRMSRLERSR